MAEVNVFNGEQLLIQVETDPVNNPGVYSADCLINTTRGIKFAAKVISSTIPDCDDPSKPAWDQTEKDGMTAAIDGAGKVNVDSLTFWFKFFSQAEPLNCRVKVNVEGGVTWQGSYHCHQFDVTGQRKEKADATIALINNGPVNLLDSGGNLIVDNS